MNPEHVLATVAGVLVNAGEQTQAQLNAALAELQATKKALEDAKAAVANETAAHARTKAAFQNAIGDTSALVA